MYRNQHDRGAREHRHDRPSPDYYLAEGTTDYGFTTYVLVQNPNAEPNRRHDHLHDP